MVPLLRGAGRGALVLVREATELRRRDRVISRREATIREVHHRVKNNLQTVASLLRLQARRLGDHPQAVAALEDLVRRIDSIALVHETLTEEFEGAVDMADVARRVVRMLEGSLGREDAHIELHTASVRVDAAVATPLAVVLNELIQNAVEHGLGDGHGTVTVELRGGDDQPVVLEVHDDGGVPDPAGRPAGDRLGLRLVRALVEEEPGPVHPDPPRRPGQHRHRDHPAGRAGGLRHGPGAGCDRLAPEAELAARIQATDPRAEVLFEPDLLPAGPLPGRPSRPGLPPRPRGRGRRRALLDRAEVLFGVPDDSAEGLAEAVNGLPGLRWVHATSAGAGEQVRKADLAPEALERWPSPPPAASTPCPWPSSPSSGSWPWPRTSPSWSPTSGPRPGRRCASPSGSWPARPCSWSGWARSAARSPGWARPLACARSGSGAARARPAVGRRGPRPRAPGRAGLRPTPW